MVPSHPHHLGRSRSTVNFIGGRREEKQWLQRLSVACNLGSIRGWDVYGVMEGMVAHLGLDHWLRLVTVIIVAGAAVLLIWVLTSFCSGHGGMTRRD